MFKTETIAMNRPIEHSSQHNNFCGVIGLLVVAGLWSAALGSFFGFVVAGALIVILFTRAQWARIVSLVIVAYVGLVGLVAALFAHGDASFRAMIFAAIAGAIFWLLLSPGMERYFSGAASGSSRVVPVAPRPGALPHLQQPRAATPPAQAVRPTPPPTASASTQEQWARLQEQLRAEQEKEERERAAESKQYLATRAGFPWVVAVLSAFMCSYAWSTSGEVGKFIILLVVAGYIAALARWIPSREFFLVALLLSGGLILQAQWTFVAPQTHYILQHHGSGVFAVLVLLTYLVAICYSGLPGACEDGA